MTYEIIVRRAARKQLDALPEDVYRRIDRAISGLQKLPRPPGVKKLADSGLWRVRVGNYRVVYAVDDAASLITVVRIARRNEDTYRRI
jgi:mRNA interferase RelE/StbE